MLTSILERGSWFIAKFGMPLVVFYHLLLTNVFLNTAAEDATGLEKLGNLALAPTRYFFEGKKAVPSGDSYELVRQYDYDHHFFLKTAASTASLPISLTVGSTLKGLSYLSPKTKMRAQKIYSAVHSTKIISNENYYTSIGLSTAVESEFIPSPKWTRHPEARHRLEADVGALKEIARILTKYNLPFWLDCGSCLGAYQYGGAIPHDWDIDIAVLIPDFDNIKNALQELDPKKYVVQDWSGRANPKSYLKVFVHESGGMIDLYHFRVDPEKKEIATLLSNEQNIFLPPSWVKREIRYTTPMPFSHVFPLKKAIFEGIEVPVPGQVEKYLSVFYGENLAPAKLYNPESGKYEKDLTHSYWQLPEAH